ncbi:MAG TPA: PAS domain-containing protein, partial [Gammaproteobacteria bacterium]|nr:PAS domain-containing protein [Gammaproteobacteria bacterium]
MTESLARDEAERGELERAFRTFNQLSRELEGTYQALQERVGALTAELEDARRARERAAHAAERTAERLQSLLATLPAGVVVVDETGVIQETNRAAEEILGANLAGQSWSAVARDMLTNPLAAGGDWLTRDGRRVTLAASPLPQESAKIILLSDA